MLCRPTVHLRGENCLCQAQPDSVGAPHSKQGPALAPKEDFLYWCRYGWVSSWWRRATTSATSSAYGSSSPPVSFPFISQECQLLSSGASGPHPELVLHNSSTHILIFIMTNLALYCNFYVIMKLLCGERPTYWVRLRTVCFWTMDLNRQAWTHASCAFACAITALPFYSLRFPLSSRDLPLMVWSFQ